MKKIIDIPSDVLTVYNIQAAKAGTKAKPMIEAILIEYANKWSKRKKGNQQKT